MILKFSLPFRSRRNHVKSMIDAFIASQPLPARCLREGQTLAIYAQGEQPELEAFFAALGNTLPLSIFMGEGKMEATESLPDAPAAATPEEPAIRLAPSLVPNPTVEEPYRAMAAALRSGESVELGGCRFFPETSGKEGNLFIADPAHVDRIAELTTQEYLALNSVERPALILRKAENTPSDLPALLSCRISATEEEAKFAAALREAKIERVISVPQPGAPVRLKMRGQLILEGEPGWYLFDNAPVASVLEEHGIADQPAATFYISWKHGGQVTALHPKRGVKTVAAFPALPSSGREILQGIAALNEDTPRLVANLQTRHTELFTRLDSLAIPEGTSMFEALFGLCAMIVGLEEGNDLHKGRLAIEAAAEGCGGGVKVDYLDEREQLNPLRTIQSVISYHLAGVGPNIIAHSLFESLADYGVDALLEVKKGLDTTNLVIGGSIISNPVLFARISEKLGKFNNLIYHKEAPVDLP